MTSTQTDKSEEAKPTREELLQWLREAADPDCRFCDGTGIFYGNVHICGCLNIPKD